MLDALRLRLVLLILFVSTAAIVGGQDSYCPSYPRTARVEFERSLNTDLAYVSYLRVADGAKARPVALPPVKNMVDQFVFAKMAKDGVESAPLTTDSEFLRRIYLDLTGRIPTYDQAQAFLNGTTSRDALIGQLLSSSGYTDQVSHWFLERFQVRQGDAGFISVSARSNFYKYIREFVERDRPYNRVVQELLTASGDTDLTPALPLLARQIENYYDSATQDFWDDFTDLATTEFLGFKTDCISCHDGRNHLEKINLYLTPHTRRDFWRLSAFFSRTRVQLLSDDASSYRPRLTFIDTNAGIYQGAIDPSRPGPRPSRSSANEEPFYWPTGEPPATGQWREEFARLLTSDRQFARAAVNYLWAYFFGTGIIDPPNGWDLSRVDPAQPLPEGWPLQNAQPELLEALTDFFIRSNYSTRSVIRLIVSSNTYQLSSRYPDGQWNEAFRRYFARYEARRLSPEQMYDSIVTATRTEPYLAVGGIPDLLRYANQLPHPYSSADDWEIESLLDSLGRGDFRSRQTLDRVPLLGVLELLNRWSIQVRTRSWSDRWSPQSQLYTWVAEGLSDDELIRRMYLATLTRVPSADEMRIIIAARQSNRGLWLAGVQWALIQKGDFLFKY